MSQEIELPGSHSGYNGCTDEQLIALFQQKDRKAGTVLYLRYTPLVRSSSARYYLPECDFEDICQEAAIGLLYAMAKYDSGREVPFAAFAKTCVENSLKNYAAMQNTDKMRLYREQISLDAMGEENLPAGSESHQNPEMLYLLKEQMDFFEKSISNKLSILERDILLYYLCGNNYKFIASKLGISSKSVDNALQRVRRKLKTLTE